MKKVTGRTRRIQSYMMLSLAIAAWLAMPVYADGNGRVVTRDIIVQATRAEEEAKYESQQTSIITSKEIEKSRQSLLKMSSSKKREFRERLTLWVVWVFPFAVPNLDIRSSW